jgi:hypothetical protein
MCEGKCEKPENLKGKPEECSQEKIKECHGNTKDHPCTIKDSSLQER